MNYEIGLVGRAAVQIALSFCEDGKHEFNVNQVSWISPKWNPHVVNLFKLNVAILNLNDGNGVGVVI